MNSELDKEIGDMRVTQTAMYPILEWRLMDDYVRADAERHMREAIAHFIQHERAELIEHDHYVEKRLELYVATPAQFWKLIDRKAEELYFRYNKAIRP